MLSLHLLSAIVAADELLEHFKRSVLFIFCLLVVPFSYLLISSTPVVIVVVKLCGFVNSKLGIIAFYLKNSLFEKTCTFTL